MPNMVLINKVTVGSGGAASIEFTGIPQTYTDLAVLVSARSVASGEDDLRLRFNSDTGNNYVFRSLYGSGGGSAGSGTGTISFAYYGVIAGTSYTANTFTNMSAYIPNYTGSSYKSVSVDSVEENNATNTNALLIANIWNNTAAITSITISGATANLTQYSTAYLYGVSNVPSSAYATGGTISSDGAYFYHTFLSSGTFTPTRALTAEVLCIAGGGGAANAGGGAGGLSYHSGKSLTTTGYTVTVGAGGTGAPVNNNTATNGSNSVFSDITSNGGGADAGGASRSGGSGSGAYTGSGGAATQGNTGGATGYGNAGGGPSTNVGGSGGGAGAVGTAGGVGGAGLSTWSYLASATGTGVSGYYAGGGGTYNYGSSATTAGGVGGGGNGGGGSGTANTGGGAGAGLTGGNGGSGIVIVRYAV